MRVETESSATFLTCHLQKIVQSRITTCKWGCDGAAFYLYLKLLEGLEGGKQTGQKTFETRESRANCTEALRRGDKIYQTVRKIMFFCKKLQKPC